MVVVPDRKANVTGRVALFGGYRMVGLASEVLQDMWQLTTRLD